MSLSIEVQPRDYGFVKLGSNHRYGIIPESIKFSANINEYGCTNATFLLKINPAFAHYDLEQFTPVVISNGKVPVWSGRIISTPTEYGDSGVLHVECQGWGQHTKDKSTAREWVVTDLSRFADTRGMKLAPLANWIQAGNVTASGSQIVIGFQSGATVVANGFVGVTLDLGPNNLAKRFVMEWDSTNNASVITAYARTHTDAGGASGAPGSTSDFFTFLMNSGASGTTAGTAANAYRFVSIFLYWGAGGTAAADVRLTVKSIKIFTDAADESGNASILKASTVIGEVLDECCPMISTDRSKISLTSLALPQFPGGPGRLFPNEVIDKANAPHGYKFYLTPDATPVPVFEAQDSNPTFVVGAQDDYKFSDPSRNDGRSMYSRAIVEYEDEYGDPAEVVTTIPTIASVAAQTWQDYNPADDDDLDWSASTFSAVLGSVAYGAVVSPPNSYNFAQLTTSVPGSVDIRRTKLVTLPKSRQVTFSLNVKKSTTVTSIIMYVWDAVTSGVLSDITFTTAYNAFGVPAVRVEVPEFTTPSHGQVIWGVRIVAAPSTLTTTIDRPRFKVGSTNIIQRRGFDRDALRPMGSRSTSAIATPISQLELNSSQVPPLKGKLEVEGRIRLKEGGSVPVDRIPSNVGRIVLLEQFRDPSLGAGGRQAKIVSAEYDADTNKTTMDLDDDANFISNLKARIF